MDRLAKNISQFGALTIFCLPAIIDVILLTFLGRGFYLTAFMDDVAVKMANYAILTALIMTGGITGWVGSTGGFYLFSFAFDSLAHFLVQRFSAAFVLSSIVAICGLIAFGLQISWYAGFVYLIYLYALTTFLNLLGMLATMHRIGSPLTSGRAAVWRCIPILLISPILTTFINGHDLLIYLLVIYTFVAAFTITFRNLLHEWTSWLSKVPSVKEKDLLSWYTERIQKEEGRAPVGDPQQIASRARLALREEVESPQSRTFLNRLFKPQRTADPFVEKMRVGHSYALWLLKKEAGDADLPELYTTTWFVQLELAFANQRQLMRGLKEHSPFITFRYSKYDLGQNVGLFLAALMDRWVDIVMSARKPDIVTYFDDRARYGICFGLLYFLLGAVAVDSVLQKYWPLATRLSDTKIIDMDGFRRVKLGQARLRNDYYRSALAELISMLALIFGAMTILLWTFVIDHKSIILYFLYISGYTGACMFQFHRCFTQDPRLHVVAVFISCAAGFLFGCLLRAIPLTADFFYVYVIALNVTTIPAAIATFVLTGYLTSLESQRTLNRRQSIHDGSGTGERTTILTQEISISCASFTIPHADLCSLSHITHRQILQCLCLDLDINTQWAHLPEAVRRVIVCRTLGVAAEVTSKARAWLETRAKAIERFDEQLLQCMAEYKSRTATAVRDKKHLLRETESACDPELSSLPEQKYEISSSRLALLGNTVILQVYNVAKWTAIISGAASDVNRELWFTLRSKSDCQTLYWILMKIWKSCWILKNFWTYAFLILGRPSLSAFITLKDKGLPRTLQGDIITVDTPFWKATGFISRDTHGNLLVTKFNGIHSTFPRNQASPRSLVTYDELYRVKRLEVISSGSKVHTTSTFHYGESTWRRWPTSQVTAEESGRKLDSTYDKYGRIISGTLFRGDTEFSFEYLYRKRPRGNTEILKATYAQRGEKKYPLITSVYWSVQPRCGSQNVKHWIPSEKIRRVVTHMQGRKYEIRWVYKHGRHPDLETTVTEADGMVITGIIAPAAILKDNFGLLSKPQDLSFDHIDLLIYHPVRYFSKLQKPVITTQNSLGMSRLIGIFGASLEKKRIVYRRLPTSVLRTALWTSWAKPPYLDAVSACFLDELILRKDPILRRYWRLRDAGHLLAAAHCLDEDLDLIISAIEPAVEATQNCPLHIKASDLFLMGLGKDANQVTANPKDAYRDTGSVTSVIFSDNGCWPDNPGGVSNCRRDLVNGHTTIRGHCLAESANDFGIPRYQIEQNINSLKILPLWGLDGKTPYHGVLDNLLQSQVDDKIRLTEADGDVKTIFVPLLTQFVKGARMRRYTRKDLVTFTNVILQMNRFFEKRDFNKTWNSQHVWNAWIEAWILDYEDPNISHPRDFFEIEQASMNDFRGALDLYICYFFIYSVNIPHKCPTVFQSTHHGISSLYGMILKYRRRTTWGIWDHAILWRETCLNISPAQCLLAIPVQSMLLAGIKLACHLAYTHVDIILPCTSLFNTDWEMDLGTDQGLRGSKKLYARKIDPIVNGIGNMDAFQPVMETRSKLPTCVMLSNVQFIKDVKNAVLAADVIVNKYGFTDYRLLVYGAQDRQPSYALETSTLIETRNLSGKVILAGFGSPKEVLKDAWIFMNSSLSEGLPLAIGEAALSGIPIVATEVGATALVLTDPDDPTKRYGEVVPPNDPEALARAQLSILAMLGPWAGYTTDAINPPPLPDVFSGDDVTWICARMYEKANDRRALGLKLREVVLRSFHGHRYLREHEQMYWIQRFWAEDRRCAKPSGHSLAAKTIFTETSVFAYKDEADTGADSRTRWQDFELKKKSEVSNLATTPV
ncbi:glycosyltransferase family 4 protein, partial [Aureobasidium melanogenum]